MVDSNVLNLFDYTLSFYLESIQEKHYWKIKFTFQLKNERSSLIIEKYET